MKFFVKIPCDVQSDMVSNEEILHFLGQKLTAKYPQGQIEETASLNPRLANFQIRPTPAAIGVYNTVSCMMSITRKKDGKLKVEIANFDSDGLDLVQMIVALFNIGKRSALIEEVAGWLTPFLQSKQNQSIPASETDTEKSPVAVPSRRCSGCGADIPSQEPVCPYCGASMPGDAVPPAVPAASAAAAAVPQPVGQGPAKVQRTYLLLGILLGGLGIHNFYAGYTVKGIAQLLITVLSGGTLAAVSWIWAIVEACTVKQDARGIPFA